MGPAGRNIRFVYLFEFGREPQSMTHRRGPAALRTRSAAPSWKVHRGRRPT
jgi:hypothetical protein